MAEDIASGSLVPVLPRYRVASRSLLAVYPRSPATPRKVQAFVDFLTAWMAERDLGRRPKVRLAASA